MKDQIVVPDFATGGTKVITIDRSVCAFCDRRVWANGLCRDHSRKDEEIRRDNERNTPRPLWAQKLHAGPEARNDW